MTESQLLHTLIDYEEKGLNEKGEEICTSTTKMPLKDNKGDIIGIAGIGRDTGIGIPEEQQKKLFSFGEFITSAGTEGEQGTGLGLLICHEFVRKNGLIFTETNIKK